MCHMLGLSGTLTYAVFTYLCICVFCICAFDTWDYHFWYPWTILFSKICHTLGLSGTLPYAVFVYLYICVFVFLYLRVWHMGISVLMSLNNPLFKNMPHVGSFWNFVICCICVFVYLCICIFVFAHLRHIIFDILEQFQKYITCWFFLALRHILYLCICVLHKYTNTQCVMRHSGYEYW